MASDINKWSCKYYKGLGTSTSSEAKEYFKNMKENNYHWTENTQDSMDLAFKKSVQTIVKNGCISTIVIMY